MKHDADYSRMNRSKRYIAFLLVGLVIVIPPVWLLSAPDPFSTQIPGSRAAIALNQRYFFYGSLTMFLLTLLSFRLERARRSLERQVQELAGAQPYPCHEAVIQERLMQRVGELESIFRASQEGILLLDRDGQVLAANQVFSNLVGLPAAELSGRPVTAPLFGEESLLARIGYTPAAWELECRTLSQTGVSRKEQAVISGPLRRNVERTLTPVIDDEEMVEKWLLVFRDITEEVELARLREDTIHMLVHDLRSPLSAMMSSLEASRVQLETGNTGSIDYFLEMGQQSAQHMLHLINGLLDIYKLESGQVPLRPAKVLVPVLFDEALRQFSPLAAEALVEVEVTAEDNLPPLFVDFDHITRALYNLLDNAIKFTPDGGHIRLWARPDGENPLFLLIGISDTGPGIPPEFQKTVFKKFQQGVTRGGRRRGTGLGLPYCKLIVEAHGGEIWVESDGQADKGSTFIMRLPVLI